MLRHKYHAIPTTIDNIRFSSKKEARRYAELKLLELAGEITALELQPRFPLHVGTVKIGEYRGDFRYQDRRLGSVVEDCKGFRTQLYIWKKKHTEAEHGIRIVEV